MVFTYPMECFVARHALISFMHNYFELKNTDRVHDRSSGGEQDLELTDIVSSTPFKDESSSTSSSSSPSSTVKKETKQREEIVEEGTRASREERDSDNNDANEPQPNDSDNNNMNSDYTPITHEEISLMKHVTVTLILWFTSVCIAVVFGNLRIVLALTGELLCVHSY